MVYDVANSLTNPMASAWVFSSLPSDSPCGFERVQWYTPNEVEQGQSAFYWLLSLGPITQDHDTLRREEASDDH